MNDRTYPLHCKYADQMYIVTGVTIDGKRFRIVTPNQMHAFGINLYRGTVWFSDMGKRHILRRVWN